MLKLFAKKEEENARKAEEDSELRRERINSENTSLRRE
jgi:hypothetical protein